MPEICCGIDEAGRGPVIGPMVMAIVCSDEETMSVIGARDSKTLSPNSRENLFVKIKEMIKIVRELRNYTMNGGKRVRPILIATAYRMFGGTGDGIYKAAISIELSQSFFLIHDEIMDRSELRRGFKSFHRKVEEMLGDIKDKEGGRMLLLQQWYLFR